MMKSLRLTDGCNQAADKFLKRQFHKLGVLVGLYPGYFIIVPVLLAALCASGFQRMNYNYDPEYLFSPSTGAAKVEREIVESFFPVNFTDFEATRISRPGKFGRVVVVAKDGGTLLRNDIWNQILYIDQIIYNVSVEFEDQLLTYQDICAQWNGYCIENEILRLANIMPSIETGEINITYPIYFDPITFETYLLPMSFGGVSLSEVNTVTNVQALSLVYFLDVSESWRSDVGKKWEKKFLDSLQSLGDYYAPDVEIGMFVSNTPAWEMERSKNSVTSTLCINVVIMVVFSLISCVMSDATKSKPLVGFVGLFSATIATIAGFGFACYVGVDFISLNFAAPFLLLGIGIDDTFVILSAWRRTSSHLSIPERLGRCYSEAAVSITVTSLTDFFSFMAGVVTPFPCVRIFCLYTGISVAFIYVWHLTLFGAFLAISGRAEKNNLHGLLCIKVTPKSLAVNESWLYRTFMTGGINPKDPHNPKDNRDHIGMVFFRDILGRLLSRTWFKALVLLIFGAYIVVACWGVTNIKEGLEKQNTANYDSYSVKFYDLDDKYFRKYSYAISVILTSSSDSDPLLYSDPETQSRIERIIHALENSDYIKASMTKSWLRDFMDYIKRNENYDDVDLPISTEEEFTSTLRTIYLADPLNPLRLDVKFNEEGNRILASRFVIQGQNIVDSYKEQRMVADLRDICNRYSTSNIQVSVFHPYFIYIDQYLAIAPQTLQCILVTSIVMMIISFFLIPSFVCSLWVAFSIVSIELGVIGYMTWWGVRLDGVALINLIMCIGFSVDFSAHICYHYITDKDSASPDERIRSSMYALGLPIIQGATSTILGVIGLAFAPSYLFLTFFKMVFLVIVLGGFHGLIILPVLLSLFGPGSCRSRKSVGNISALSTPSTTISCKMRKATPSSCYTVNIGYASSDISLNSTPTRNHRSLTSSPASSTSPLEEEDRNDRMKKKKAATITASPTVSTTRYAYFNKSATLSDLPDYTFSTRLDPVIETEERNQQLAVINQLRSNGNLSSLVTIVPPLKQTQQLRLGKPHHHHHHHRHHPHHHSRHPGNPHKRICRSKSHRPNHVAVEDLPGNSTFNPASGHAPLRKYHSFPYELFNNETGYSSDESARSGAR